MDLTGKRGARWMAPTSWISTKAREIWTAMQAFPKRFWKNASASWKPRSEIPLLLIRSARMAQIMRQIKRTRNKTIANFTIEATKMSLPPPRRRDYCATTRTCTIKPKSSFRSSNKATSPECFAYHKIPNSGKTRKRSSKFTWRDVIELEVTQLTGSSTLLLQRKSCASVHIK